MGSVKQDKGSQLEQKTAENEIIITAAAAAATTTTTRYLIIVKILIAVYIYIE